MLSYINILECLVITVEGINISETGKRIQSRTTGTGVQFLFTDFHFNFSASISFCYTSVYVCFLSYEKYAIDLLKKKCKLDCCHIQSEIFLSHIQLVLKSLLKLNTDSTPSPEYIVDRNY